MSCSLFCLLKVVDLKKNILIGSFENFYLIPHNACPYKVPRAVKCTEIEFMWAKAPAATASHSEKPSIWPQLVEFSTFCLFLDCNHIRLNSAHTLGCHLLFFCSHPPLWLCITSAQPHHNLILRQSPCLIQSGPFKMHKMQLYCIHCCYPSPENRQICLAFPTSGSNLNG